MSELESHDDYKGFHIRILYVATGKVSFLSEMVPAFGLFIQYTKKYPCVFEDI